MNLALPFPKVDPARLDELLGAVEVVVDEAFLAEVDSALDRIRLDQPSKTRRPRRSRAATRAA